MRIKWIEYLRVEEKNKHNISEGSPKVMEKQTEKFKILFFSSSSSSSIMAGGCECAVFIIEWN